MNNIRKMTCKIDAGTTFLNAKNAGAKKSFEWTRKQVDALSGMKLNFSKTIRTMAA